jgi:N utilization substance protein B
LGRKFAREVLLKTLYQADVAKIDCQEALHNVLQDTMITDEDKLFVQDIIRGVSCQVDLEQIDNLLNKYAVDWPVERISPVERAILRIAIYEILFRDDIPLSVSINEAVELGKKYSGPEAGRFINGVLGGVSKDIQRSTLEG